MSSKPRETVPAEAAAAERSTEQPSVDDVLRASKKLRERLAAQNEELDAQLSRLRTLETDVVQLLDQTERYAGEVEATQEGTQAQKNAREAWKRSMGRISKVMKEQEELLRQLQASFLLTDEPFRAARSAADGCLEGLLQFRASIKAFEKSQREADGSPPKEDDEDRKKRKKRSSTSPERSPRSSRRAPA
jgi:SMC interacting uncharacterized protein involved in chromosome segregation